MKQREIKFRSWHKGNKKPEYIIDTPPTMLYENYAGEVFKWLKERYGLDITPIEYIDLIQQDFKTISIEQGKGVSKVLIMFKDVEIIAIKQRNRNKFLVTALPKN